MKKLFVFLLLAAFAWGGLSYYRNRSSQTKVQAAEESQFQEAEAQPQPQPQDPIQPPTVVSPLKSFMEKVNPFHKTPEPAPPSCARLFLLYPPPNFPSKFRLTRPAHNSKDPIAPSCSSPAVSQATKAQIWTCS